jgi:hypothetical protein
MGTSKTSHHAEVLTLVFRAVPSAADIVHIMVRLPSVTHGDAQITQDFTQLKPYR